MIRRLYDWTLSLSAHPRALWALAAIAFVESSFFPIPPDILMIPMILNLLIILILAGLPAYLSLSS